MFSKIFRTDALNWKKTGKFPSTSSNAIVLSNQMTKI